MKMKNLAILIAMILFSCSVATARDLESFRDEKFGWWWHYPYYRPYFHPRPFWTFPAAGKALPPLPSGFKPFHPVPFKPPPEVTKCLSDGKEVRTCFHTIIEAFITQKPALGADCCDSIKKMDDDCEKTVFGAFKNPFFNCFVKLHCSTKAASTPPTPSTPSSPSPA